MTGEGFGLVSNRLKMCMDAKNSDSNIYAIVFLYKMSYV